VSVQILIADDSQLVRRLLRVSLEQHEGWRVCAEAKNGQQAVEKATETKPDLIVLDWVMPVMDGLQAAREIARILPVVPILMFTLHDSPAFKLAAKRSGVRRVVSKADSGAMISAIEGLLSQENLTPVPGTLSTR